MNFMFDIRWPLFSRTSCVPGCAQLLIERIVTSCTSDAVFAEFGNGVGEGGQLRLIFLYVVCSAHLEWNLDGLLDKIWEYLNLIRVYTKPKGNSPDYEDPVILSAEHSTVEDFCERIHKDMVKQFKL